MVSPRKSQRKSGMFFENHDIDSRAGKLGAKHHAGWATASDATAGLQFFQ